MLGWWPVVKVFARYNTHLLESMHITLTFWNYIQNLCRFPASYNSRNSWNLPLMLCWWPCVKIFPENNAHAFESVDTFLTFSNYVQNLCRFAESYTRETSWNLSLMLGWWVVVKTCAGYNTDALQSVDITLTFWNYVRNLCQFAERCSRRNSCHLSLMLGWWVVVKIFAGYNADALKSLGVTLTLWNYAQNLCWFAECYRRGNSWNLLRMLVWWPVVKIIVGRDRHALESMNISLTLGNYVQNLCGFAERYSRRYSWNLLRILVWWPVVKIFAGYNADTFKSLGITVTFWNYIQNLCRFAECYSRRNNCKLSLMLGWWTGVKIVAWYNTHLLESMHITLTFWNYVQKSMPFCWTLQP